jgi:hydrogenase maturation protease
MGNVLRADDAFGVHVARRMEQMELPAGVKVVEMGIAGMALVHELQDGWDALVVLDSVDLGRPPGQVMMILPDVIDVHALTFEERMDVLADGHLATPERVFMLSRALNILPEKLMMIGCQPEDAETPGKEMSAPVAAAVDIAIAEVFRYVGELQAEAEAPVATAEPGLRDPNAVKEAG